MLAQLNSQMRVAQNMMMRLSEFSMIPRMILASSGSVNRVAALLDAVDPAQYDALNDAPGNQISGSRFLGRFVGLFIRAAFVTSFAPPADGADSKSGGDGIGFAGVDVSTPSGTRLIEGLTFDCQPGGGDNMLVVGENGVGKVSPAFSRIICSSLRIRTGLKWPCRVWADEYLPYVGAALARLCRLNSAPHQRDGHYLPAARALRRPGPCSRGASRLPAPVIHTIRS